jgi:hypothetical protein
MTALKSIVTASLAGGILLSSALASAQAPSLTAQAPAEKTDSINVSPLGLLFGTVAVTYEHLWNDQHGLILEGEGSRSANDTGSAMEGAVGVGYRWHWSKAQSSGFLGIMAERSLLGSGTVTVDDNGQAMTYKAKVSSTSLTLNIGKRWMLSDSLNLTLRFGVGRGWYSAQVTSDGPHAMEAEQTATARLSVIPVALDGELSLGYTF